MKFKLNILWCFFILAVLQMPLSAMTTRNDRIINSSGQEIELKGINWFGFNNEATMVDGLWDPSKSITYDFATGVYRLQLLGFNAIRIPFSFKDLYQLAPKNFTVNGQVAIQSTIQSNVTNPAVAVPAGVTIPPMVFPPIRTPGKLNDYLPNDSTLNRFIWVVNFFAKNGFYVLIDNHREDSTVLEDQALWLHQWTDLVTRLSQDPVTKKMLMIDILNEPDGFDIRWEANGSTPALKDLYLSVMDALFPINPDLLFFIEGTGQGNIGANWGDGFATDPALISQNALSDPRPFFNALLTKPYLNQVVISPHVYPPSVTGASSDFSGSGLANRLSNSFGYLTTKGYSNGGVTKIFPVALGEFGSRFATNTDVVSMRDIAGYLKNSGAASDIRHNPINHWFYWSWNPNSSDTGGLVDDNWLVIQWNKINYLSTISLVPWYKKSTPIKTGTLSMMLAPVSGLSVANLQPIIVGNQIFQFSDFNVTISKTLPTGNYQINFPILTSGGANYTAAPQTITIIEGQTTPVQVNYVQVTPVPVSNSYSVIVQLGTPWQQDGLFMCDINFRISNLGSTTVSVPWKLSFVNSSYKKVIESWNMHVDSLINGKIVSTVSENWETLLPRGGNTVDVGLIVSSTSNNFMPASFSINGKSVPLR